MSIISLDNIRINIILERINNEINYINNSKDKDDARLEYLQSQQEIYKSQLNNSDTSPIDKVIKTTSLSMSPDQIITSKNDLDKFINDTNNRVKK